MSSVSTANADDYKKAMNNGQPAELEVWGILRGGWYFEGKFFFTRGRYQNVVTPQSGKLSVKILG